MLGAAGYTEEHPLELYYRDAKQLTVVEGTSQIQLNLIAAAVLQRDLWWG
jgi:alkylation response protein AidB-like acyl-CoA dehydrogenase